MFDKFCEVDVNLSNASDDKLVMFFYMEALFLAFSKPVSLKFTNKVYNRFK